MTLDDPSAPPSAPPAASPTAWWHVVWVTRLSWPPHDPRGDWRQLARFYRDLTEQHGSIATSAELPPRSHPRPQPPGSLVLSPTARTAVAETIRLLAHDDRLAGDTPLRALAVRPRAVHVVLACPPELLQQRVGRLKSRSSHVATPEVPGEAATWGRGFWRARLEPEAVCLAATAWVDDLEADGDPG